MKRAFILLTLAALTVASPARAQDKVLFVFGSAGFLFLPYYIADVKGYFTREGIKNETMVMKGGPLAMTAVLAGDADILGSGIELNITTHEKGRKITAIAAMVNQVTTQLTVQGDVARKAGLTEDSLPAARLKALKGLTIGITGPGSSTDRFLRFLVKEGGFNPDRDLTIVPLGSSASILASFQQKRIDGFVFSSPTSDQAILGMGGFSLINLGKGEFEPLKDFLYNCLSATPEWLAKNPDKAVRVVRAINSALRLIHENPEEAKAAGRAYFPKLDPKVYDAAFRQSVPSYPRTAQITKRGLDVNYSFIKASEGRVVTLPQEVLYSNEYVEKAMGK